MSRAGRLNLKADQGSTLTIAFQLLNKNTGQAVSLNGATITAQLRKNVADAAATADFSCSVVSGDDGTGQCVLSAALTAALIMDSANDCEFQNTCFAYDVQVLFAAGNIRHVLFGKILFRPEVTK